jgi:phosphoglycerate dehydrogenase-like enzyme
MKILVAEPLAQAGIDLIDAQPGWKAVISNPKDFPHHLADADALLVRTAKVTKQMLAKAPRLIMI